MQAEVEEKITAAEFKDTLHEAPDAKIYEQIKVIEEIIAKMKGPTASKNSVQFQGEILAQTLMFGGVGQGSSGEAEIN